MCESSELASMKNSEGAGADDEGVFRVVDVADAPSLITRPTCQRNGNERT